MKLLTNPIFLRMAVLFFACGFAFVMAMFLMRRLRQSITEEASIPAAATPDQIPLHAYHAVIQELKQQKHELSSLRDAEHRRAKTSENISAAVLSSLSIGVLFFGPNGLVRQGNHAAKTILGIASPTGMDAVSIFRQSAPAHPATAPTLAEGIQSTLQQGDSMQRLQAEYFTPAGERRVLEVTASQIPAADGSPLGVACLIEDQTEIADIRRQIEWRGEMSAEMALALRNSLVTISGYAQQLAANRDPDLAAQLATDIATEAKHLNHTIGGFLAESRKAQT
ncbi:MAG TPA: hypothetical protein VK466_15230, partial [Terriglobales bacterium]|nr:hypothetical protein [Terriglobales bacterium]